MRFIASLIFTFSISAFAGNDNATKGDSTNNAAAEGACDTALNSPEAAQERFLNWLRTEPKKIALDVDPAGLNASQLMLRKLFINSAPEYVQSIFSILSKEDIYKVQELSDKNELQLSELQKNQLNNLVDFIRHDPYDVMWDGDGAFSALITKYPDYSPPGYKSSLGGVIGGMDTSTIRSLEKEIVNEALTGASDRFQRGGWFKRFWSPQYPHVSKILGFFNWIRESLDHVKEVGDAIKHVIERTQEFNLTPQQLVQLNAAYESITTKQRKSLRLVSEKVLGQDVFTGGYQSTSIGGVGIHQLSKNIDKLKVKTGSEGDSIVTESEYAMDLIHQTLNENRKRNKQPERTVPDFFDTELKVRHRQYDTQSKKQQANYLKLLEQKTPEVLSVSYSWTELQSYKEDGKTKFRSVTKYGSGKFHVLYQDILIYNLATFEVGASFGRGHSGATIDSVTGLEELKHRVKEIVKSEGSYHVHLAKMIEELKLDIEQKHIHACAEAKTNPESLQTYLTEIQEQKKMLEKLLKTTTVYSRFSANQVSSQWSGDNYKHFKARTAYLVASIVELVSLHEIYLEQVQRHQYELIITPDKPDYSTELAKLKFAMTANKVTKVTGIGTIIVGAICGPMVAQLGWSGAAAIECLQVLAELANAIAQAAGSD